MHDIISRFAENLVGRVSGPMRFRLVLQPMMAIFFAIRAGLSDAKAGRPPYFWSLVSDPEERGAMLKDGWKGVGKIFILALILDAIYQLIELQSFYPGEALIVAFVLAIVPYVTLRGLVTRIAAGRSAHTKRSA